MLGKSISRIVVVAIIFVICGCKKSETPTAPPPAEPAKTAAEYKAEAARDINEKNMAAELDKIEREMEKEAAAEGF